MQLFILAIECTGRSFLLGPVQVFRFEIDQRQMQRFVQQQRGQLLELIDVDGIVVRGTGLASFARRAVFSHRQLRLVENLDVVEHFRRVLVVLAVLFVELLEFADLVFELGFFVGLLVDDQLERLERRQWTGDFLSRRDTSLAGSIVPHLR